MPDYIILSHRHEGCVRLTVEPGGGITLHDFSCGTPARVQLDQAETQTLLQALPREALHAALDAQLDRDHFLALDDPPARCSRCHGIPCFCEDMAKQKHVLAALKQYGNELYRVPEHKPRPTASERHTEGEKG